MMNSGPVRENTAPAGSAPSEPCSGSRSFCPIGSTCCPAWCRRPYAGLRPVRYWNTGMASAGPLGENGVLTGKVARQTHMHKTKVSRAVAQRGANS